MTNKEAISIIESIRENHIPRKTVYDEALELAINALEEAQLDVKTLKLDLPELFRPSYDGGYLRGEEE